MFQRVHFVMLGVLSVKYAIIHRRLSFHLTYQLPVFVQVSSPILSLSRAQFLFSVCQSCFHVQCHKTYKYVCPKCQRNQHRK